jgi:hypothetical protein
MNFRSGRSVPAAEFDDGGQVPRHFEARQPEIHLGFHLSGLHISMEPDGSCLGNFVWPFARDLFGRNDVVAELLPLSDPIGNRDFLRQLDQGGRIVRMEFVPILEEAEFIADEKGIRRFSSASFRRAGCSISVQFFGFFGAQKGSPGPQKSPPGSGPTTGCNFFSDFEFSGFLTALECTRLSSARRLRAIGIAVMPLGNRVSSVGVLNAFCSLQPVGRTPRLICKWGGSFRQAPAGSASASWTLWSERHSIFSGRLPP